MTVSLGIPEPKLSELVEKAEAGEEVIIEKEGQPVARLVGIITMEHALAVRSLPMFHKDPFDRMLVAQARVEGLTLVTADAALSRYDVPILDASK